MFVCLFVCFKAGDQTQGLTCGVQTPPPSYSSKHESLLSVTCTGLERWLTVVKVLATPA